MDIEALPHEVGSPARTDEASTQHGNFLELRRIHRCLLYILTVNPYINRAGGDHADSVGNDLPIGKPLGKFEGSSFDRFGQMPQS
jgi:hypothetical protein